MLYTVHKYIHTPINSIIIHMLYSWVQFLFIIDISSPIRAKPFHFYLPTSHTAILCYEIAVYS